LLLEDTPAWRIDDLNQPVGMLPLMSEFKSSLLCAISAAQLLAKMLDFQKNLHAENVTKEFGKVSTEFLSRFQLECLLEFDGCRK